MKGCLLVETNEQFRGQHDMKMFITKEKKEWWNTDASTTGAMLASTAQYKDKVHRKCPMNPLQSNNSIALFSKKAKRCGKNN